MNEHLSTRRTSVPATQWLLYSYGYEFFSMQELGISVTAAFLGRVAPSQPPENPLFSVEEMILPKTAPGLDHNQLLGTERDESTESWQRDQTWGTPGTAKVSCGTQPAPF